MKRNSFTDCDGKKGTIGDKVIEYYYGEPLGDVKVVNDIISKGRGGTRIYFENGGYGKSKYYKIQE